MSTAGSADGRWKGKSDIMAPEQLHTVKSFDADLQRLANLITRMGGCAETQIEGAIRAMATRDTALAGEIIEADARIDRGDDPAPRSWRGQLCRP